MKQYTYISLLLLCSCAGDPFVGDGFSNSVDAGNEVSEADSGNNSSEVLNQKEDSNNSPEAISSVDAGTDQNNLPDNNLLDVIASPETSTNDVQDSGTTEEAAPIGPCVPKTCLTLSVEASKVACGIHWDGCTNYIECPVCDPTIGTHVSCGGDDINPDATSIPGTTGFCGGGCVRDTAYNEVSRCSVMSSKYKVIWVCGDTSLNPPKGFASDGCMTVRSEMYPFKTPTNKWCCVG